MDNEEPQYGYVFLTDEEEAEMMSVTVRTIKKYHKQLIDKGMLEIYINEDGVRVKKYKLN